MLDELANTYQRDNAGYQEKLRLLQEENQAHVQALREAAESGKVRQLISLLKKCIIHKTGINLHFVYLFFFSSYGEFYQLKLCHLIHLFVLFSPVLF